MKVRVWWTPEAVPIVVGGKIVGWCVPRLAEQTKLLLEQELSDDAG